MEGGFLHSMPDRPLGFNLLAFGLQPPRPGTRWFGLLRPDGHVAAISFLSVYTRRPQHAQPQRRAFCEKFLPVVVITLVPVAHTGIECANCRRPAVAVFLIQFVANSYLLRRK
jgi:hypothetical protein